MDTISQILKTVHLSGSHPTYFSLSGEWGFDITRTPDFDGVNVAYIHYVVSGESCLETKNGVYTIRTGDFVLLPRWNIYRATSRAGAPCRLIHDALKDYGNTLWQPGTTLGRPQIFQNCEPEEAEAIFFIGLCQLQDPNVRALLGSMPDEVIVRSGDSSLNRQVRSIIEFMSNEARLPLPGYSAVGERLMEVLFIQVLRTIMQQSSEDAGSLKGAADPRIGKLLTAVHEEPHLPWTVEKMAKAAGLSRTSFINRFSEIVGVTPVRYLSDWRMHIAASLLALTDKSIQRVGEEVGYPSPQCFTRAFRRATGSSPKTFRKLAPAGGSRKRT